MSVKINYDLVPVHFMYCANNECLQHGKCLRNEAMKVIPTNRLTINVINPTAYPHASEPCDYFKENVLHKYALGFDLLFNELPHALAIKMRSNMIGRFGKNMFYRFKRKERYITPKEQRIIVQLFRDNGYKNEIVFDNYSDLHNWD